MGKERWERSNGKGTMGRKRGIKKRKKEKRKKEGKEKKEKDYKKKLKGRFYKKFRPKSIVL